MAYLRCYRPDGLLTPTHYVSASGSASWANATNPVTPCSAATAMANAVGDNVVEFATGRYTLVGTGSRQIPALNPTYSGTEGHSITFQANGVVDFAFSSGTGPVFGGYQKSYLTWHGFTVDQALCPGASGDESPVTLWSSGHCIIEYCDLDGNGGVGISSGALHSGVRLDGQDAGNTTNTVRYNYIHDVSGTNTSDANCAGVLDLDSLGTNIVEHNEFSACNCAVFLKRSWQWGQGQWHIRYNYIHDGYSGIRADMYNSNGSVTFDVYQNLLVSLDGLGLATLVEPYDCRYIRWVNNTVVGCAYVGCMADMPDAITDAAHVFWNNILVDCGTDSGSVVIASNHAVAALLSQANLDAEHNIYHGGGAGSFAAGNFEGAVVRKTFAEWHTTQDLAAGNGQAGAVVADPLFTNEAGGVYTLQAGSPARDAGVDILNLQGGGTSAAIDCGCYVTGDETIGRA
jgi:hypothetical protein